MSTQPDDNGLDPRDPRLTAQLFGHGDAEVTLAQALESGRLAHAWLLCGPKGIGKATLAWRLAAALIAEQGDAQGDGLFGDAAPVTGLAVDPDDSQVRLIRQGSHPDVQLLSAEASETARQEISVDAVRKLAGFFALTPSMGGKRVAIVDAADQMNRAAANALLKTLEEPPKDSILILLAHAPGRLLPTIISRCRRLNMRPLGAEDMTQVLAALGAELQPAEAALVAELSGGSPGHALDLVEQGGLELFYETTKLLGQMPTLDTRAAHSLAERFARKEGEGTFRRFAQIFSLALGRVIRAQAETAETELSQAELAFFKRISGRASLEQCLEVWEKSAELAERALAVNLDRKQAGLLMLQEAKRLTE